MIYQILGKIAILCFGLIITVFSIPEGKIEKNDSMKVREVWGKESKGLISRIWIDNPQLKIGEPITIHYQIKNISSEPLKIWNSGFWQNHLILVKDSNGKEISLTQAGEIRKAAFSPGGERDKNYPYFLKPGQIDNSYQAYNLTDFFVFTTSQTYFIQYLYEEYQGGWEGKMWSNTILVHIDSR